MDCGQFDPVVIRTYHNNFSAHHIIFVNIDIY